MSDVFVSNRFEELVLALGEQLFAEKSSLFGQKLLVLPSLGLKSSIYFELLKSHPVALGIRTLELGNAILYLSRLAGGVSLNIPTASLLSLKLENLLVKEEGMTRKKGQKMADILSHHFLHYGKYGGEEFLKWRAEEGWQQALFNRAFQGWDVPLDLDKVDVKQVKALEVHLFALPFLPAVYRRFFERLEKVCKVCFYEMSPCRMYMGDIYSEWEKGRMKETAFMDGHNALLANLGRISREKFKALENKELIEGYIEDNLTPIQKGLLDDIEGEEGGVEVHEATSSLREVEIVYKEIILLLEKYKPSDIAVFAPDINKYASLIHLVFGSHVPYYMTDLEKEHPMVAMLELDDHRWDLDSVFALLPSKFHVIRSYLEEEGVRWGLNASHRRELLGDSLLETGHRGTWEGALENLIRSVAETSKIEFSKVELLAEFAAFIAELKREKEYMTLGEWTAYFRKFYPDFEGIGEIQGETFPLESVKRHFLKVLKRKSGTYKPHQVEAIRFSSLKLGTVAPYRVIVMMGVSQGEFPRVDGIRSLCEIKGEYAPTANDEDRHAFLDLLGASYEKCIMTYVETASPVLELLMRSSQVKAKVHPLFSFHQSYASMPVSKETALAAKAYYGAKKISPFVPEFLKRSPLKKGTAGRVAVSSLIKLMKHPMKFYCNERLKLYLEERKPVGGEFTLSYLDRHKMKKKQLPEAVMPHGWYRDIACEGIEEEKMRHVELNGYCRQKTELADRLVFPAVVIEGVSLEGVFDLESEGFTERALKAYLEEGIDKGLSCLINYYLFAKETMSPLHPNWADPFLLGDQEKVEKEIEASVASGGLRDLYLERIFKHKDHYAVEVMMDTWEPVLSPMKEWF